LRTKRGLLTGNIAGLVLCDHLPAVVMPTGAVAAGTLPYMAPELLVGGTVTQHMTNRVDIYSMAMMMWEMISGSPPWQGMNDAAIVAAVSVTG
jgi:serine/threonine protein kinase